MNVGNEESVYTFYSQQGEDVFVYRNFLNRTVEDGVCVEVGAFDGISGSNTKFFEDVLGYKSILIEPLPHLIPHIYSHRPQSLVYNYAIHPTETRVRFLGNSATAGILSEISDDHLRNWLSDTSSQVDISAAPLAAILHHAGVSHIDFLSIDVEGGERLVLESIDWTSLDVFVICIELDGTRLEKDDMCRSILRNHGFVFQARVGNNDVWMNPLYSKKESRYSVELPAYSGYFQFLNEESQRTLPDLLAAFHSPLDILL